MILIIYTANDTTTDTSATMDPLGLSGQVSPSLAAALYCY